MENENKNIDANQKPKEKIALTREELERKKRIERENRVLRQKYFDYYDDVKTNIREDW